MSVEEKVAAIPSWIAGMEFCHISCDWEGLYSYCGDSDSEGKPATCGGEYHGEAICTSCGHPTCPRCAQLSALDDELDAA